MQVQRCCSCLLFVGLVHGVDQFGFLRRSKITNLDILGSLWLRMICLTPTLANPITSTRPTTQGCCLALNFCKNYSSFYRTIDLKMVTCCWPLFTTNWIPNILLVGTTAWMSMTRCGTILGLTLALSALQWLGFLIFSTWHYARYRRRARWRGW